MVLALVLIEGKDYALEFEEDDTFVADGLSVAYCEELARDYLPIIYDPRGYGSNPKPPELIAYRLVVDKNRQRLCVIYEVYWKRQDCSWQELNKDHDHDYEQLQVHFDLQAGVRDLVVVSSTGPIENGGHGVEVYSKVSSASFRTVVYMTANDGTFPWGGKMGQNNATQVREIPIEQLLFEAQRPPIVVLNCYHVFAGLKRWLSKEEKIVLSPKLERLDRKLLEKWYYLYAANRFGHDVSNPFDEPYLKYFPPPEDWVSRVAYGFLWVFSSLKRVIGL